MWRKKYLSVIIVLDNISQSLNNSQYLTHQKYLDYISRDLGMFIVVVVIVIIVVVIVDNNKSN